MIKYFKLGYINNVAARFWAAPYIGVRLALELQDFNRSPAIAFESDLGTTPEHEGLHEFGYFWRRWFRYGDTHQLSEEQVDTIDVQAFRREIAAIESVFSRPVLFKNASALSLQVGVLAEALPKAVFIHCRRDPLYVAQSLLCARRKRCGDAEDWFSIRPREYVWLKEEPYIEQVMGQVFYTLQRVDQAIASLPPSRRIDIDYEVLCRFPVRELTRIACLPGCKLSRRGFTPPALTDTNKQVLDDGEFQQLREACNRFFADGG